MGLPEFAIVHVFNPFPDFRLAAVLVPTGAEVTVIEAKHLRRQPGGNMHAVGDVPDRNFVFGTTGIEAGPHGAGNFPVQGGHGIGPPREFQPQHRHAELLVVIAGILPSERHEAVVGKTENIAQRPQMLLHQAGSKAVMAGGHRSVGGKTNFARHAGHRLVKAQALLLHTAADGFEHRKAAVPFVQMQDAGSDAHGFQGAKSSHAEQQFLADTDAAVAAVQPGSEFAVFGSVAFDVGVEKQQVAAPNFHAPDFGADGAAAGLDFDRNRRAVGPDGGFHRQLADIGLNVFFHLPAILIEPLAEVSLAIKQTDANQRNTQVGCALDVIAGQDTETPGIFRDGNVQPEFGGEISHGTRPQNAGVARSPGPVGLQDTRAGGGRRS